MSSAFAIAFYGVRYAVAPEELESLETRADQRLQRARSEGLETFWSRFGDDTTYFLFVGKKLSLLSFENELSMVYPREKVETLMRDIDRRLYSSDWKGTPYLYLQWGEDV